MEESKLKREIENFSMQLLHNKVQVTAGGFFPIDFTLLYTVRIYIYIYIGGRRVHFQNHNKRGLISF